MPLHCTGLGKAILSASPPQLLDDVVAAGLQCVTASTIVCPQRLRAEVAAATRDRVAFDNGESTPGVVCIAAPVTWGGGSVAALSVTGCAGSLDARALAPLMRRTATALSDVMVAGYYAA
jgi:DNA-binding IclR family transcriptional regulator